jgi:hypothetical protein
MTGEQQSTSPPEAGALFAVTIQGHEARSEIVVGLDAVREAVLQAIRRGARDPTLCEAGALVASLSDSTAWAKHGSGDGRPFWHWWAGLGDRSISVQRITQPVPADADKGERQQTAISDLHACGVELRRISSELGGTMHHRRVIFLPVGSE